MRNESIKTSCGKEPAIARKVSSLKSFFGYLFRSDMIRSDPMEKIKAPKLREKEIIRLDEDEIGKFLKEVKDGDGITGHRKVYHDINSLRDYAMLSLMLSTGIRVSECVGINIKDVDFKENGVLVHRKGGKEMTVYFNTEVEPILREYIEKRKHILAASGSEDALFLSMQKKRITARSIERIVKGYAKIATPLKKITPHKLRSTYGTSLYNATGDIKLVADVLGHSDVNTTSKHYISKDDKRKTAKDKVHLF